MIKNVDLSIADEELSALDFVKAWRMAEQSTDVEPVEKIYFQDLATLMHYLTPRRLELLKMLSGSEVCSIREVARRLHRDYKSVHRDITALAEIGLIQHRQDKYTTCFETIRAEFSLAA